MFEGLRVFYDNLKVKWHEGRIPKAREYFRRWLKIQYYVFELGCCKKRIGYYARRIPEARRELKAWRNVWEGQVTKGESAEVTSLILERTCKALQKMEREHIKARVKQERCGKSLESCFEL